MLIPSQSRKVRAAGKKIAVIASQYNERYVDAMLKSAEAELKHAGAKIKIVRVPGAFEIPVVAAKLARTKKFSGIVCLGLILRGETVHAAHIGDAVSRALMQIQVETEVPVIHEVLLLENEQQARVRCLGTKHNRGTEAAQTVLEMARVMAQMR